ncbi:MAG: stage III sporulation protein AB [Firmicutes bacterium]|nr:stage III sporulation protein AB [Bacillota bacterium]
MINVVLGCVLLGIASYIGYQLGNVYRRRQMFFEDIVVFCVLLESEVGLFQNSLPEVFGKPMGRKDWQMILAGCSNELKQNNQISAEALNSALAKLTHLSAGEIDQIGDFILSLGRLDVDEQVSKIKRFRQAFEQRLSGAKTDNKKKGGLYTKMGVIVGVLCLILVI